MTYICYNAVVLKKIAKTFKNCFLKGPIWAKIGPSWTTLKIKYIVFWHKERQKIISFLELFFLQ